MASCLSRKLTHLSLVLLVVTISSFSAQAHRAAVSYVLKSYIRYPLYLPNGSSTITKAVYISKNTVGVVRFMLVSLVGDQEESNVTLVWGVTTPHKVSNSSNDYDSDRLQPVVLEEILNSSDPIGNYAVASSLFSDLTEDAGEVVSAVGSLTENLGENVADLLDDIEENL